MGKNEKKWRGGEEERKGGRQHTHIYTERQVRDTSRDAVDR